MADPEESYALTPHLIVTRQQEEILDDLVDYNELPTHFDVSQVRSFFAGEDFHLVLYFGQKEDRGFQMYIVRDFSRHVEELFLLRNLFSTLIQQGHSPAILTKAHYRVEDLIHMTRTLRALLHG